MNQQTPEEFAAVVQEWAKGKAIQVSANNGPWYDDSAPAYGPGLRFRVKPAEPERSYPETKLSQDEILSNWYFGDDVRGHQAETLAMYRVANAALRHACDNGQIVTREDFDRLVVALQRIADIENKAYGTDWEEIEEARQIALEAIKGVTQ